MTLNKIMHIRHRKYDYSGGIFFNNDKFYKTRTILDSCKGKELPVDAWEEIKIRY